MKTALALFVATVVNLAIVTAARADESTRIVCSNAAGAVVLSVEGSAAVTQADATLGLDRRTESNVVSITTHDRRRGYAGGGGVISREIYVEVQNSTVHQLIWLVQNVETESTFHLRRVDDETKVDDGTNTLETNEDIPCQVAGV